MKSKISCFNKTIFKKNITHFWPIWALYLCYTILILPVNLWQRMSMEYYYDDLYAQTSKQFWALNSVMQSAIKPFMIFIFAAVAVMAVFSYLYTPKNANMIHSLPVNRLELFVTNTVSAVLFLVIPEIIAFIISVFVGIACGITSIEYLFLWLVCSVGESFFAVALAVFVAMFTGQLLAMPVYYFICNYLYVGCFYIASTLINTICYGVTDAWHPGKLCILSPVYYLNNNLRCRSVKNETTGGIIGVEISGMYLVGIYAIAAVIILLIAYRLYKARKIETAGDLISISFIKPVFRWGAAICGGFLISNMFVSIFCEMNKSSKAFYGLMAGTIIIGFGCFFGVEMLIQKSFRVFRKKTILEWAVFSICAIGILNLLRMDVFGIERKVPEVSEIERAYISFDYPLLLSGDELKEMLAVQKQIIDAKEENIQYMEQNDEYGYAVFRYYLKNGEVLERAYYIPTSEEEIADESTPTGWILSQEAKTENIKRYVFGSYYEQNEYYSGDLELYDAEGNYESCRFTKEELEEVVDAAMKDIEEGNYARYQLYYALGDDDNNECYYNGLSLNYYNEKGIHSDSDDFYYVESSYGYEEAVAMTERSGYAYLSFGEDCTNLVQTLKKLGVINDEWHLYTYKEYNEIMGWD